MKKTILFLIVSCLIASFSFAGIEWTAKISMTGKAKNLNNDMISHVYAQGGNLKQVFEGVKNESEFFIEGGYWLFKAQENNIYIVSDKKKNYMVVPLDLLLQATGAMGQLVKIEISEPSVKSEILPGETLLGLPCNHMKIITDYGMKMKILFIKQSATIHEEREIWSTSQLKGMKELNQLFLNKNWKTGIADLDELIQKEIKQQKEIGFPVKMISRSVNTVKNKSQESTTSMEITKIEYKNFPDSFFEIPASYAKQELLGGEKEKKFGIF
ncbi:MAG: DUF4412 domain-containing protein [Candidatus Omnitrophota bacterium]